MTNQQGAPEALRLADELEAEFAQGRISNHTGRKAATELRRQHTRIAELQSRIKTMAEDHADELMVAHLDGRMRAEQPAGAQQPGDERAAFEQWSKVTNQGYDLARNVSGKLQTFESTETEHAWRGFFHGLRASHGQAPAQAAPELTETAVTAKNPAAPVSSFDDSRTQAVYEVLVNDNYPPAGSNEHWEGWKARLIVDALFPMAAPAAVAGPSGDETQKLPGIVDKALNELAAFVKFLETVNGSWNSRTARDALRDIEWFARRKLAAAPTNQPAPQQEAQEPCPTCAALARTVMLDQVSFDRKPDCYGIRQITDDEGVEEWEDIRTSPDVAREEANDMMATGRGEIYEVVPLYTTPQPVQVQAHAGMVPLTKEQRNRIVLTVNTVSEAIDMVERHHGIKGGLHGADS